jgi:hypothetical protein
VPLLGLQPDVLERERRAGDRSQVARSSRGRCAAASQRLHQRQPGLRAWHGPRHSLAAAAEPHHNAGRAGTIRRRARTRGLSTGVQLTRVPARYAAACGCLTTRRCAAGGQAMHALNSAGCAGAPVQRTCAVQAGTQTHGWRVLCPTADAARIAAGCSGGSRHVGSGADSAALRAREHTDLRCRAVHRCSPRPAVLQN